MFEDVSRRTFLKGTAATAALAAAGSLSLGAWRDQAQAAEAGGMSGEVRQAPSLCNGCSSKCGLVATTVGGKLYTLKGNETHPYSKGRICGRGHGLAQMAYSDERVTQPLRRKDNGEFEPIDWDTAFKEIGEKVKGIIAKRRPRIAGHHPGPASVGQVLLQALHERAGSANVYAHSSSCNLSKESAYMQTMGATDYSTDFGNAKMVMFIGRSYGDGIRPSSVQSLASAKEAGTRIVSVDPRLNNSGIFSSDWVPINPGTDLAFIMALCNVLIEEDLYDHEFVEQNTVGFDEFAAQAQGVHAGMGRQDHRRARRAHPGTGALHGEGRSGRFHRVGLARRHRLLVPELVRDGPRRLGRERALGLLGSEGRRAAHVVAEGRQLSRRPLRRPGQARGQARGNKEYPLALDSAGTNLAALQAALDGSDEGPVLLQQQRGEGLRAAEDVDRGAGKTDLVVTIDVQMSETAQQSDYVLPEVTYLERLELPEFIGGKKHFVGMRTAAIDKVLPEAKTCDEIFNGLAEACGVGEYFQFTAEDWAEAQLATVGVSLDQMKKEGVVELPDPHFEYGVPKFKTASGKFEF